MKKILAFCLTFIMIFAFSSASYALDTPVAVNYTGQSYVGIKGNAGEAYRGYDALLMLVKKGADLTNLADTDIGYVGQTTIGKDGDYAFEFEFSGFEYENNIVSNYQVVLNVAGNNMTPTISKAEVLKDLATFDFDFTQFGSVIAKIDNIYSLDSLQYSVFVAFYDDADTLLGVKHINKMTGDDLTTKYTYDDIPEGTSYAKGFIWENTARMIPLSESKSIDIEGYTTNRKVKTLMIAPGIDETARNFAWYDERDIKGAKIQYAIKESEADLTVFPESRAKTVEGVCENLDIAKFNGTPLSSSSPDVQFKHEGDFVWAKASITNLEQGKTYVYRVGDKLGWCRGIYEFKTESKAEIEDGFDVLLFADEHSDAYAYTHNALSANREKALSDGFAPDASLIIAMGDNVDYPWDEAGYTNYFDRIGMTSIPLATVSGNLHDMILLNDNKIGASLIGYHFNNPNQSKESGYIENVGGNYWYRYGNCLFIGLTHNGAANKTENSAFIQSAVDANKDAKWKILTAHWPFFISVESEAERNVYFTSDPSGTDFIADKGIDLVLSGHTHDAYRTKPMYAGQIADLNDEKNETVYVCLSTSGFLGENFPIDKEKATWIDFADYDVTQRSSGENFYHTFFSKLTVENNKLVLTTYKNTHNKSDDTITATDVIDTCTIEK